MLSHFSIIFHYFFRNFRKISHVLFHFIIFVSIIMNKIPRESWISLYLMYAFFIIELFQIDKFLWNYFLSHTLFEVTDSTRYYFFKIYLSAHYSYANPFQSLFLCHYLHFQKRITPIDWLLNTKIGLQIIDWRGNTSSLFTCGQTYKIIMY